MWILSHIIFLSVLIAGLEGAVLLVSNRWSAEKGVTQLEICYNFTGSDDKKDLMTTNLTSYWGIGLKKLPLTGFKDCSEVGGPIKPSRTRVVITPFVNNEKAMGRSDSLGSACYAFNQTCIIYMVIEKNSGRGLRNCILHEFSHFLGFIHEYTHPKYAQDKECMEVRSKNHMEISEPLGLEDDNVYYSPEFDSQAINNVVCGKGGSSSISRIEQETLDKWYNSPQECPPFDQAVNNLCKNQLKFQALYSAPSGSTPSQMGAQFNVTCSKNPETGYASMTIYKTKEPNATSEKIVHNANLKVIMKVTCERSNLQYTAENRYYVPEKNWFVRDRFPVRAISCGC